MNYNPFADYGNIVTGERFVGRKKEITQIQNRVFGINYGNLAIMGLPRIGKSSLAWNAIISHKEELESKNIIPIRINAGEFDASENLYQKFMRDIHNKIKVQKKSWVKLLNQIFKKLSAENLRVSERNSLIEEYFLILKENKYRAIYVLDEFDAVRNYLGTADFQFLRELSYNPETKVCLVTVSRRTLKEIEPEGGTISNFYQTFTDLYLGMFSEDDLQDYWNTFFNSKIPINDIEKQKIYDFTGKHPFLLDIFNYHLFNNLEVSLTTSIEKIQKSINLTFLNNYKTIFDLLESENLGKKLLQMVVGPVYDITTTEAEIIERYDLVYKSNSKKLLIENNEIEGYNAFARNFESYLNALRLQIPIWSKWNEAEGKLRSLIYIFLVDKYGHNWLDSFLLKNPKKRNIFYGTEDRKVIGLVERMEREAKTWGERVSSNLLDFTYPQELFDGFITTDKEWFLNVLGKDINYWTKVFQHLTKIRNPLAHSKENILKESDKGLAVDYCQEIITKIDEWMTSRSF
jgi:hypothetical protein